MAFIWDEERQEYVEVIKILNPEDIPGVEGGPVNWDDVKEKPGKYQPIEHNHDDLYYTKDEVDNRVGESGGNNRVKASENDDNPDYLDKKVDNVTIEVEDDELKVKNIEGLTLAASQLNDWLGGTERNVQDQFDDLQGLLNAVSAGMQFKSKEETYADMQDITNKENGDVVVVLEDEERDGNRTMYIYNEDFGKWDYIGSFKVDISEEFTELKDTPSDYQSGKYLRSTSSGIVYDDVNYQMLKNKPSSTITDIDNAVEKTHEHENKSIIDKLEEKDGELFYGGEIIGGGTVAIPKKEYIYAKAHNQTGINNGKTLSNYTKIASNEIDLEDGKLFKLKGGKTYFITANLQFNSVSSYGSLRLRLRSDTSGGLLGLTPNILINHNGFSTMSGIFKTAEKETVGVYIECYHDDGDSRWRYHEEGSNITIIEM